MSRDDGYDYHVARLLVMLRNFAPPGKPPLTGLTKVAKLDFLLRYPHFTDRLVRARGLLWPVDAVPSENEALAVESRMTRYKYGPWDDRYYPLLGALIGTGLITLTKPGGVLKLNLTDQGATYASALAASDEWHKVDLRAAFLAEHFDLSGNALKNIIYAELPDAVDRPQRAVI